MRHGGAAERMQRQGAQPVSPQRRDGKKKGEGSGLRSARTGMQTAGTRARESDAQLAMRVRNLPKEKK